MKSAHVLVTLLGVFATPLSLAEPMSPAVPGASELQIASYIPATKTEFPAARARATVSIKSAPTEVTLPRVVESAQEKSTLSSQATGSPEALERMARQHAELEQAAERLEKMTRGFSRLRRRGY